MGNVERKLATSRGVQAVVAATADAIAVRARANLAAHTDTGQASITVDHSGIDSEVTLDDPASLSIEYGRGAYLTRSGAKVGGMEGLHVLGRAVKG